MPPIFVAIVSLVIILAMTVLGQLSDFPRPTQGRQIGMPYAGWDVVMPLSIAQCESVLIYYNITTDLAIHVALATIHDANFDHPLITLSCPKGIGYLDWICNIPMGYTFLAEAVAGYSGGWITYHDVQPGSSSACLGDVTTSYSYANYHSINFQSYTQHSSSGDNTSLSLYYKGTTTIAFPSGTFSTITVNPSIAITPTPTVSSPTPTVSSPLPSPSVSSPGPSHRSSTATIAGAVVGAVVGFGTAILGIFLWRYRRTHPVQPIDLVSMRSSATEILFPTDSSAICSD